MVLCRPKVYKQSRFFLVVLGGRMTGMGTSYRLACIHITFGKNHSTSRRLGHSPVWGYKTTGNRVSGLFSGYTNRLTSLKTVLLNILPAVRSFCMQYLLKSSNICSNYFIQIFLIFNLIILMLNCPSIL